MKKGRTGKGGGRKTRKNMNGGSFNNYSIRAGIIKNFRPNYLNMYGNVLNKTQKKGLNTRTGLNMNRITSNYDLFMSRYRHGINNVSLSPENYANSKIMEQSYGYHILILQNLINEYLYNYVIYPFIKDKRLSGRHNFNDDVIKAREEQARKEYYTKYQRNPDNDAVDYATQVMDILIKDKYISLGPYDLYSHSRYKLDKCGRSNGHFYDKINSSDDENTRICKEVNNIKHKIGNQILNPGFFSRFF